VALRKHGLQSFAEDRSVAVNVVDYYPYGGRENDTVEQSLKITRQLRQTQLCVISCLSLASLAKSMTPDPLLNSGQPRNPQGWNRYP
jgi:hypothetical protein